MSKIIAHRGASFLSGEDNTLKSFELAIELGADMVEFDVRKTKDNVLIAFHDKNLNDLPVSLHDYATLEKEANQKGFHIPQLKEVLNLCHGKIRMDIEIKESGYEAKVVGLCTELLDYNEYTIKSFKEKVIYKVKNLDSNITTGLLLGVKKAGFTKRISEYFPFVRLFRCKCDFVSPNELLATKDFLFRMKLAHYPVYVWTVNNEKGIKKFLKRKVEGIITDKPDVALELLK